MKILPIRGIVFVVNVMVFDEHGLGMKQTMDPVKKEIFKDIKKYKLSNKLCPIFS
jgi:hypothetical protein